MQNLAIGLISGTSMDGVDAALIDCETNQLRHGLTYAYPDAIKKLLNQPITSVKQVCQLNTLLGEEFSKAALLLLSETKVKAHQVSVIGSHGQTIIHDANADIPYTMQLACAHTIAERLGITVIADFRTRDLVAKGKGAPLAPLFHQAIFNNQKEPLAIVNIGGISNITYLSNHQEVLGYDTGPGNCLLDAWIKKNLNKDYDTSGSWSKKGKVNSSLLNKLLADPYFVLDYPKSIGKEYFSLEWLEKFLISADLPEDVQATLVQLTAITIANQLKKLATPIKQLVVVGGGAHNTALIESLQCFLTSTAVHSSEKLGINPDFLEAHMFAWLAVKTLNKQLLNLKSITGSIHPIILGAIYLPSIDKVNCLEV